MIELIYGEEIVRELTDNNEIYALLMPCLRLTKFMDDKNAKEGIFDRLEKDIDSIRVGSNHVGHEGYSYYWHVSDISGKYKGYITKEGNNLWFRFDKQPMWRIQLLIKDMENSCILCSSQCKKDKPCGLFDGVKLVN